ncbi:MAG: hypothetical protein GQ564_02995 [Bacteroidales bacterium]|nr:hypothetical protein [Bacteroidales bacterium]
MIWMFSGNIVWLRHSNSNCRNNPTPPSFASAEASPDYEIQTPIPLLELPES